MADYERKVKESKPVVAICYDFDKTLSPTDMQAQGYIQNVGCDVSEFWKESNGLASKNDMDQNLAWMYMMKEKSEGRVLFTRSGLMEYGSKVQLFPGVETWFERIRKYGEERGIIVEHYIISSGLKEMIEGTSVAQNGAFEKIYASSFYYNEKGVAVWPAQVVNYTNKTQFLFRIEKGVLDINDAGVNESFSPEEVRVPFRNMVYIGDSDTDIPCMKLVNTYGGHSIGVYNSASGDKSKVYKMVREGRIKYYAAADYNEGTELDRLLKAIVDRTAVNEQLEDIHYANVRETEDDYKRNDENEREKTDLLIELENSSNFVSTHEIVKKMREKQWRKDETEKICHIAVNNSQVRYILGDIDISAFYKVLLKGIKAPNEDMKEIISAIGK